MSIISGELRIIRTRRKTIALEIRNDGSLIVRAPFNVKEKYIKRLVRRKSSWIKRKIKEVDYRNKARASRNFVDGEKFPYLGCMYPLKIIDGGRLPLFFRNGFFLSENWLNDAREVFIRWYRERARENIAERVSFYTSFIGRQCNKVGISSAKYRWGSCSNKGNLNFNWRLIMAPVKIINYVVVHETAHLVEMGHSEKFWNIVRGLMPDYNICKNWLNKEGWQLMF